jgi:hypothetical protein
MPPLLHPRRHHRRRWTPCLVRTPPTTPWLVTSPPDPPRPNESIPQTSLARTPPSTSPRPCHSNTTALPSTHRAGDAFLCTCACAAPVPHTTVHGDQRATPSHPRLALSPIKPTQTGRDSDAPGLKPRCPRPNRYATDTATPMPGLGSQHRPETPPSPSNSVRSVHRAPWASEPA